jgi:hypothetical protein
LATSQRGTVHLHISVYNEDCWKSKDIHVIKFQLEEFLDLSSYEVHHTKWPLYRDKPGLDEETCLDSTPYIAGQCEDDLSLHVSAVNGALKELSKRSAIIDESASFALPFQPRHSGIWWSGDPEYHIPELKGKKYKSNILISYTIPGIYGRLIPSLHPACRIILHLTRTTALWVNE